MKDFELLRDRGIKATYKSGATILEPTYTNDQKTYCYQNGHDGLTCACSVPWRIYERLEKDLANPK